MLYPVRTHAGLKAASWNIYETLCFQDSLRKKIGLSFGPTDKLDDCFQLAIVDGGEGGVEDSLLTNWPSCGYHDDIRGLLVKIGGPLLEDGELDQEERSITNMEYWM